MLNNIFKQVTKINCETKIRHLSQWRHRLPKRVLAPEEFEETDKKHIKEYKNYDNILETKQMEREFINQQNNEQIKPIGNNSEILTTTYKKSKTTVDMLETTIDDNGNLIYKNINSKNSKIGPILASIKSNKYREKNDLILLEGKRLIKDALKSDCILKYLLFSRVNDLEYLKPHLPNIGIKLYKLPYNDLQNWSDLTTNPGIMGIFKIPDVSQYKSQYNNIPLTVICDNVREPGNLGAILRVCAAVGCQKVILLKGCVNLWESKVLRSSMGAHFNLQIHQYENWNNIKDNLLPQSKIFIADNRTFKLNETNDEISNNCLKHQLPFLPYYGVDFKVLSNVLLVVGGETHGISEESYITAAQFNGGIINVPINDNIDSLNVGVALGIIAFEIKKQLSTV